MCQPGGWGRGSAGCAGRRRVEASEKVRGVGGFGVGVVGDRVGRVMGRGFRFFWDGRDVGVWGSGQRREEGEKGTGIFFQTNPLFFLFESLNTIYLTIEFGIPVLEPKQSRV